MKKLDQIEEENFNFLQGFWLERKWRKAKEEEIDRERERLKTQSFLLLPKVYEYLYEKIH